MAIGAENSDYGFRDRFKLVLSQIGTLQKAADLTGYSSDQVAKWRDGTARAPFLPLSILAQAAGMSLDWLAGGESAAPPASEDPEKDVAAISVLNVLAGAGDGMTNGDIEVIDRLPFSRLLLRRIGVRPEHAHFIHARGDSMEPTIRDGAIVLVDRSVRRIRDDGIYALVVDGDVRIKRVDKGVGGLITLMSDNPRYPPETLSEATELRVEGRVFWTGGTV